MPEATLQASVPAPLTTFSEDESLFRDNIHHFADETIRLLVKEMDEKGISDKDLIHEFFQLGLMGIEIPEQYGGGPKLFEAILAVETSFHGLVLDLPATVHAHPVSDSHANMHTHPGGKVLAFSPLLFDAPQDEIRFTIAHEIAHVVLCHTDDSPNARNTGRRQERDADSLAEQWGFMRPPTVPAA
jgi:Acyl-CoA dehydrogenase, N-terminal domain/Peptidase family M48